MDRGSGERVAAAKLPCMIERPTAVWRERVEQDAVGIAAGTVDAEEAFAARLYPADMIRDADKVLDRLRPMLTAW